ncbi:redoxin domain-containing protein [Chitinophaga sp. S165]|uniref:redoxin domain-containing protein n=1 Tax=Chitinophaga sp. S165 TaxID=2135462 RepID=UPI000D71A1AC|nr:redoxin domain-containing protein [Chitinophaga sp. S165]PWV44641.1 uncharacterized protein DUF3738 [Chitinophaga sp. S165]
MARLTLVLFIGLFCFYNVQGQPIVDFNYLKDQPAYQALKVGDRVPDLTMTIGKSQNARTVKFSQFKGKLVILDFWSKWCTSCIQAFPEMQKLQDKFGDKIQIILVTTNTEESLKRLFEVSPNVKNSMLPMILGDTSFEKLFPHIAVPFHVWISQDGIVEFTTQGWNTTKDNISDYLSGKKPKINQLVQSLTIQQTYLPMLQQMNIYKGQLVDEMMTYSMVTKRSMVNPRTGWIYAFTDSIGNIDYRGATILNEQIIGLFRYVHLANKGKLHIKTIVELKEPKNFSKYYPLGKAQEAEWRDSNTYCYEVRVPNALGPNTPDIMESKLSYIKKDLERYFLIESSIQKKVQKCLVLKVITGGKLQATNSPVFVFDKDKNGNYTIKKGNVSSITEIIENELGDYNGPNEIPVLDETRLTGNFDFDIKLGELKSLVILNNELKKYGLQVAEEEREIECLVLKEI